jgi:CBS domain containing-hemolysin-like protein
MATVAFAFISESVVRRMEAIWFAVFLLMIIIFVSIAFDIVGTAATAATEAPLNAMAARKITGAQEGLYLVKNADKVANFSNDVIGDIAGTVAGALGITLMSRALLSWPGTSELWLNILMTASIASIIVAGKAMGKKVAVTQANQVIFLAGRVIAAYRRVIYSPVRRRGKNSDRKVRGIGRS